MARPTQLRLAPDLVLPLDFATQGVVVIGVRGSGKSNTEVRFAELLFGVEIPFVAIDPKGDWYGIRMDGTAPGLPVPVFGGLFGDFPLDASLGRRIADLLVDNNISAVLDVSRMSHTARSQFLTDFFHQLMDRHQVEPHARCVIFEEAHRYIPQNVTAKQARLKEAAAAVLLEGRSFGLGCWACTQRPARLHNDVLEEVDTAIIHRIGVTATADLKRVREWVKHEDLSDEIAPSLTKLAAGEAWVLSPVSLGLVQRTQIDRRTTFDSGATPVVGSASVMKRRQSTMADIDAPAMKEALADAIDKAKADDPTELRRRIRELEKQLSERAVERAPVEVEVPVLGQEAVEALRAASGALHLTREVLDAAMKQFATPQVRRAASSPRSSAAPAQRAAVPRGSSATAPSSDLPGPQRKLLTVLATYGPRTKRQLALLAGYSMGGGGFNNPLGALRSGGLVTKGEPIAITDDGVAALGAYDPPPSGRELLEYWLAQLPGPAAKILSALAERWPQSYTKEQLATATGYSPVGGGFNNPLGRLRTLGLVTRGVEIRLTDDFGEAIQ